MSSRYDEIYSELIALLAPYNESGQSLTPATKVVDDLGMDSVQVMEVLMELEDRLDVSIPLNFLPDVQTIDDLVRAMDELVA